jgi:5-methylcytosine-specific restriction protein A
VSDCPHGLFFYIGRLNQIILTDNLFQINQVYRRREINEQYGGNRQSGISVSAKFPFVFIFSGQAGHQHGYKDQWENDDVFSYTGEGQIGNMQFKNGNLAIRDHLINGKRIFLFTAADIRSHVIFEGELTLIDFDFFIAPDREGNIRTAIKFFLQRINSKKEYRVERDNSLIVPSVEKALATDKPNVTERTGLVTSRVGQGAYRKSILYRWDNRCAVTGYKKKEILIASHILPWRESDNDQRLDVDNGILLSPIYDALFDKHLISFENNGKIILSNDLLSTNFNDIGVSGKERVTGFNDGNKHYLELHRVTMNC